MFDRRVLALLILCAWGVALGWHARRVFFPSAVDRLSLGVRTLPPGVAYYAVFRDDRRAGWGQTEIDTLASASGFRVRDRLVIDVPGVAPVALERTHEEFLDAELHLDSLTALSVVGTDSSVTRVRVIGDSVLHVRSDAVDASERMPLPGPVTTQVGWRLRFAAGGGGESGDLFELDVFDAAASVGRSVLLEVLESGPVAFADSADTDSISGAWIPVREDTVRAWRVNQTVGAVVLENWVDEDGRLVDGEIAGGYRVERTAFELAFFTRPGSAVPRGQVRDQEVEGGDRE